MKMVLAYFGNLPPIVTILVSASSSNGVNRQRSKSQSIFQIVKKKRTKRKTMKTVIYSYQTFLLNTRFHKYFIFRNGRRCWDGANKPIGPCGSFFQPATTLSHHPRVPTRLPRGSVRGKSRISWPRSLFTEIWQLLQSLALQNPLLPSLLHPLELFFS